ncbi:MAG: hypothetical protein ACKUBY_01750 [Candidatus Moraniibacteriota bacterium]|jgi:hypothetical protein
MGYSENNSCCRDDSSGMLPALFWCFIFSIIMITIVNMDLNNKSVQNLDYYPMISTMNVHSQNSGLCYKIVTHFSHADITKSPTLLTRAKCDDALSSKELIWNFINIPETGSVAEQCFETVIVQQEVFTGHDDLKIEVTGMAQISCADLPNG